MIQLVFKHRRNMVEHLLKRAAFNNLCPSIEVPSPKRSNSIGNQCSVHDLVLAINLDNYKDILKKLHFKIYHSSAVIIDEENDDGMCLLEHLLSKLQLLSIKDMATVDAIELILVKTILDYECYKNGNLLTLMKSYDKREPETVKYAQWLIMTRKDERFYEFWHDPDLQKVITGSKKNQFDLFKATFVKGSCDVLKFLMRQIDVVEQDLPILITAAHTRSFVDDKDFKNYFKCFEYVLNHKRTDVNAVDSSGSTALHVVQDKILIRKILEKKPYFGVKNNAGESALQHVDSESLTLFFNSLIGDSVYDVNIDCRNFQHKSDDNNLLVLDLTPFHSPLHSGAIPPECKVPLFGFETLLVMVLLHHLQTLFKHPLLKVFFELYWTKYKKKMLWDRPAMLGFAVLYLWLASTRSITSGYFNKNNTFDMVLHESIIVVMHLLLITMVVYMILYYGFVMYMFYFSKLSEYFVTKYRLRSMWLMDVPLLVLICTFIFHERLDVDLNQVMGVGSMILSIQFTISFSFSNQTLGINLIMLFYVSWTALKFLGSTFLIIFGFGLSFMHLLSNFDVNNDNLRNTTGSNNETHVLEAHNAYDLLASLFKTVVMMTGELDRDNINFRYGSSYVIFILFIFIVPIIFVNLLNGLAIGDIQMIQEHAEFQYRKAQLLIMYQFCWITMVLRDLLRGLSFFLIDLHPNLSDENAVLIVDRHSLNVYFYHEEETVKKVLIGRLTKRTVKELEKILHNGKKAFNFNA